MSKTAFRDAKGGLWQNGRLRAVLILAFFLHEIYVQRSPDYHQCGGREGEGVMVGPAERVAEKQQGDTQAEYGEARVANVFFYE